MAITTRSVAGVQMIALSEIRHDQNVRQEILAEEVDALAQSIALLGQLGDAVNQIHTYFPIANTDYLAQSFGYVPSIVGVSVSAPLVDAVHAVAVLLVWLAAFIVLSGLLTRARDVN